MYRINEPNVKQSVTVYDGVRATPAVEFQPGDTVEVTAGGCVQIGGVGRTWKRYVNPSGPKSDKYYFGKILIPGVTSGLVALRAAGSQYDAHNPDTCTIHFNGSVPTGLPDIQRYLQIGYADDGYGDNGYSGHDDGTENQCKGEQSSLVRCSDSRLSSTLFQA